MVLIFPKACNSRRVDAMLTHMYPAQSDEIILVLYEKEFLLIFCVTIVRSATLLWYDDVGHSKSISGLDQTQKAKLSRAANLPETYKTTRGPAGSLLEKMLSHVYKCVKSSFEPQKSLT